MGIRLRINKGPESIKTEGGLLSNVTGKVTIKTPLGNRGVTSDGSLTGGRTKTEPINTEPEATILTSKPTSKPKKGSK